jgi:AraC-like DNA-binding protein
VLRDTRSRFEGITLSWLSWILIGVSVVEALDMASFFSSASASPGVERVASLILFVGLLIFVNMLVFKGLRHPQLFRGITPEEEKIAREQDGDDHATSASPPDPADADRLRRFMATEKPYLEPDLTLAGLATALSLPARQLSRLINRTFRQNFSDFINSYRVDEAKSRLLGSTSRGESVLDLLYAVGFNSKSSFNAAFKRHTGLTPTEYRKRHRP